MTILKRYLLNPVESPVWERNGYMCSCGVIQKASALAGSAIQCNTTQ